jgi:uncharacterized protein YjbI with pentapeptide repeats
MTKYWTALVTASLATLLATFASMPVARADIFKWEYINPANPSLGKQQSSTLAPDGAGVNSVPGTNLSNRNLTMGYLIGANIGADTDYYEYYYPSDLTGANLTQADLTGASLEGATATNVNFTQANLEGANITDATLTGATFAGAEVRGAAFARNYGGSGISLAQLYSTASYQAHDLRAINLGFHNLAGANFAGQNLANARLDGTTLTGADLSGAEIRGATISVITAVQLFSTASYQLHDLTGTHLVGDFTGANFASFNLAGAGFKGTLTNADLSYANLTNAYFGANLTGANLSGAMVREARFTNGTSITAAQLYSTASYQAHDLTGIHLDFANFAGANFAGQNLTNANFSSVTLTIADFSQANLTNASFYAATLSGANLTGAEVRGASFNSITTAQLYSTASYQNHDLARIKLMANDLNGANFAGQNLAASDFSGATLANADFSQANLAGARFSIHYPWSTCLTGANLSQANLTNADFSGFSGEYYFPGAYLDNANLSGADARGANFYLATLAGANLSQANLANARFWNVTLHNADMSGADARGADFQFTTLAGANTSNLIQANGHIAGVNLTTAATLTVRNYHGAAAPKIVVEQQLVMDATGTLRLVFDADPWDSTISFAPGIPVTLGGTLELTFASGVNVATQVGRTIDLFDWTGVTPTGTFTVESPYTWNLTNLYTTGEVTLTAVPGIVPGDFNNDKRVDAADYVVWRKTGATPAGYTAWRTHFGQPAGAGSGATIASPIQGAVPESSNGLLLILGATLGTLKGHRMALRGQLVR